MDSAIKDVFDLAAGDYDPIKYAVQKGSIYDVRKMLELYGDRQFSFNKYLVFAIDRRSTNIAKLLIDEFGADLHYFNGSNLVVDAIQISTNAGYFDENNIKKFIDERKHKNDF